MSTFPPRPRLGLKIISIIVGAIVVVGGIGYGTFTILKKVKAPVPFTTTNSSQSQATTAATADQLRQQAEQLVKDHKLTEAKAAYQAAATSYAASGNTAAALDAKQQIAVVETAIKTSSTPGKAPAPKVTGSDNNHYQQ